MIFMKEKEMSKKILLASVLSIILVGNVQASDDVYVDLSVLDTITQDSTGLISSQPLFPTIKPTIQPQKKQNITPKRKVTKNLKKPEPVKPKAKINTEKKSIAILPETSEAKEIAPIQMQENKQNISSIETKKYETNSSNTITKEVNDNGKDVTIIVPNIAVDKNIENTNKEVEKIEKPLQENVIKTENISEAEKEQEEKPQEQQNLSAAISDRKTMDQSSAVKLREVYAVSFNQDMTELSDDALKTLDVIIQSFDKNSKKKISIKAYNYEDGQDSFRKKRISLNRATEVRSYFLNHGFKNFSIKIINTTTDNEYKNTVEIEQID